MAHGVDVTTNSGIDPAAFEESGYAVVPDVLTAGEAADLYSKFDSFGLDDGRRSANERILLQQPGFLEVVRNRRLLAAVETILGPDLQLLALDSLETAPHAGEEEAWHVDFHARIPATVCVNCGVYLTDMTAEMGPLRVAAGSHRWTSEPDHESSHRSPPGAVEVPVPAGSAVLFDAQIWHSGSPNRSDRPRRAVFAYFGHYWMKRMDDFYRRELPPEVTGTTDPALRQLFGISQRGSSAHGEDYRADNPRWW